MRLNDRFRPLDPGLVILNVQRFNPTRAELVARVRRANDRTTVWAAIALAGWLVVLVLVFMR